MKASALTKTIALLIAIVLAAPTVIVVGTSITSAQVIRFPPRGVSSEWYQEVITSPVWRDVALNSAQIGLISSVLSTAVGTSLAFGAARGSLFPPRAVATLAMLPLLVPSVVAAIGFYFVYIGTLGAAGNEWTLGIAGATTSVPLTFLYVYTAIGALDRRLEEAAEVCGANRRRTLMRITLPILFPSIIISGLFAFVTSWEEIVVGTFLAGPGFKTVPLYIYGQATTTGLLPSTSAASVLLILVSMLFVGLVGIARRASRAR